MKATQPLPDEELARRHDPRRLIVFGIITFFVAILLSWTLYTVRSTLIIVYISALMAMGISPLVGMIERQRVIPIGGRLPRWLAISFTPRHRSGGRRLRSWCGRRSPPGRRAVAVLPEKIEQAQAALVRMGIIRRPIYDRRDRAAGAARRWSDRPLTPSSAPCATSWGGVRSDQRAAPDLLHAGRIARHPVVLRASVPPVSAAVSRSISARVTQK